MKYLVSAVVLLIGAGGMSALWMMREQPPKQQSDALIAQVSTAPVDVFQGELDLEVSGTVVPFREIRIGAEVAGVVARKYEACQAGNLVKRGTKLLEIDQRDYKLEIKTLESEILQANRTMDETDEEIRGASKNLEIAKSDMELQQKEFARVEKLRRSVAAAELDQARRALLNSESQLTLRQNAYDMLLKKKERLKSTLELINNRMERALLNLERTVVTAPADGVIVQESVEQGDFVSVARDLLVFECTAQVEVLSNLTPGELEWLRQFANSEEHADSPNGSVYGLPQLAVVLYEQNNPSIQWHGVLERIDGIGLNESTKSIPCRIVVKEPVADTKNGRKKALVRGMYLKCRMVLPVDHLEDKLVTFPSSGLRPGDYVWVVREEKLNRFDNLRVVDRSPPQESFSDEANVVIDLGGSGLVVGDQVVTGPLPQPIVGGRVLLIPDPPAAEIESDEPVRSKVQTTTSRAADSGTKERS